MKKKQYIIYFLILVIGITIGLGLGFWVWDNQVKIYTVYQWTWEEK